MSPNPEARGPLAGIRVLDLSRVLAGPLCTMTLGDLGADVLKIERPGTGDDTRTWGPPWSPGTGGRESAYYLCVNRNKRSAAVDLKTQDGRDLVRRLARDADVLVENYAPGTLDGWGLGFDALAADNPGLVYCSITGYGSDGPEPGRPGYDFAVQARSGWMSITGEPDGAPTKAGIALVDVLTGQNAAIAILAALREREISGRGQRVEVALYDSAMAGLVNVAQAALVTGNEPRRWGNAHATIVPYQTFAAADRPVAVAVGNDAQWRRLCGVLGADDLRDDERFATNPGRVEHRELLVPLLAARFRTADAAAWLGAMEDAGVPCAPVQTVGEALRDPVLLERDGLWQMEGATFGAVPTVASPLRLDRTPASPRLPAPALGQHTAEVVADGWAPRPGPHPESASDALP
ncbi:CaiB/BaiF CoA transferase family protein [Longimicrobium terrae]|uniref:Crotonobetainyl-CoA:carnitine CoA-transferase CaiB-like acyl-CoA transferase n=1 Tax=Longimicrobium terrae TaxID=1639882 RepID=A0A841H0U9_9BACT|nr:CoA transferase [Longimicrobium terrae]MBB4637317.1 crotonobetainyl-CoA:carnitine CoA-transferase CaiB-like acyl-CoA transferase [Longimicrobium terrae]MBB6071715.1 crotonobetainyl-CoA:carnitine CoA-transferase CaiB-like acyl-CoA transferase [Longimicrobium terrae]NNC28476.1 CoA transferase [Longimicrobium terrae]